MQKHAYVTDSGVNLVAFATPSVTILPNTIFTGSSKFLETDYAPETALSILRNATGVIAMTAPDIAEYARAFSSLSRDADVIICVCPSRLLLPHWEHAQQALRSVSGTCPIKIIDSQSIGFGQALILCAVIEALQNGVSPDDVESIARAAANRGYFLSAVEEVAYLSRVETLEPAHAVFSAMLNVRPLVAMEHGYLHPVSKARTRAHALERLLEFASEFTDNARTFIFHDEQSVELGERLCARLAGGRSEGNIRNLVYNPSLAAVVGLGAVGIAIQESAT